jgi:thioredoxin-dependent peroxiredoxin
MTHLRVGDKAPDFRGIDQHGNAVSLGDYSGKKLVLYFYPKDNTLNCTIESCNLRDNYHHFKSKGYEILGVSLDNERSHQKFIQKYQLPFNLLADVDRTVSNDYGVYGEKKMFGFTFNGIRRTTFVISEHGIIERIIEDVKNRDHANQIMNN